MEDAFVDLKQTGAGNAGSRYIVDHASTRRRSETAINHLNKECND
ncbi:hypothetical protein RY831_01705 [Noviherbaspirillum sp. CPCC 100848]|uniref:Uncharacterized protein n=1 Tax=Noviherbaspirillum album TaxID=3080276 RepID=A0ABU6J2W3_9BURK|nr:hypothetical protein [Noviherbaspirillum sp. CPCC 100848]MEC4717853.1 hypothetical protein [Noviherbaspirillum sp. CPCC 100848]